MIDPKKIYCISDELVTRMIEDELVIVPILSDVGDLTSDMFSLNETGVEIWKRINGINSVQEIIDDLSDSYDSPEDIIEKDVLSLMNTLFLKKLIFEK